MKDPTPLQKQLEEQMKAVDIKKNNLEKFTLAAVGISTTTKAALLAALATFVLNAFGHTAAALIPQVLAATLVAGSLAALPPVWAAAAGAVEEKIEIQI